MPGYAIFPATTFPENKSRYMPKQRYTHLNSAQLGFSSIVCGLLVYVYYALLFMTGVATTTDQIGKLRMLAERSTKECIYYNTDFPVPRYDTLPDLVIQYNELLRNHYVPKTTTPCFMMRCQKLKHYATEVIQTTQPYFMKPMNPCVLFHRKLAKLTARSLKCMF